MLITDLRHFAGIELDPEAPAAARRLYGHLAAVVRAATALPSTTGRRTVVCCRRRPRRTPCSGRIVAAVGPNPPTVHWTCPSCGDQGIISGWRGTAVDLLTDGRDGLRAVRVSDDAYQALLGCLLLDRDCERVIHTAEPAAGGVTLCATDEEWEGLRDAIAAEANHATRPRRRRLDDALRQLDEALEPPRSRSARAASAGPVALIPQLTRLAAERDVAAYCECRIPPAARHQLSLDRETNGARVTIVERRVPFDAAGPVAPAEWTRLPVAQLRFGADRLWRLYWRDADERWHLDRTASPSPDVDPLLRHLDADHSSVFWG